MRKICLLLIVLLVLMMCACTPNEGSETGGVAVEGAKTPEEALEVAMSVLSGEESDKPVFLGADGTPVGVGSNTGLAAAISSQVTYEVKSVVTEGESSAATLEITAPDVVDLVYRALEGMTEYDEEILLANMEALLESAATKTYTVEVELVETQGAWCIVPNAELSNAITGGLIEEYAAVRQKIMDSLLEGGGDDA